MSKADYKGYELIKAIHDGKIKDGKIIEVHDLSTLDHVKARIEYSNKRLIWIAGEFDMGCLFDDNIYFRVLEDNREEIEELECVNYITTGGEKDLKDFVKKTNKVITDNFYLVNKIIENQNKLVRAVNQIRKEKE